MSFPGAEQLDGCRTVVMGGSGKCTDVFSIVQFWRDRITVIKYIYYYSWYSRAVICYVSQVSVRVQGAFYSGTILVPQHN
jgi:hypothetical protein